jgi:predicted branched-subunit amino acid permease
MDAIAPIVMSGTTFAGSAQVATVSVLGTGGGVVAAIVAAVLLNARYAAIGISVGPVFRGRLWRRLLESQLIVDESWAVSAQRGRVERRLLVGAGATLWLAWTGGTAVGSLAGNLVGDPNRFGFDGAFPALFLALLTAWLRDRRSIAVAAAGAVIALVLVSFAPAGVPIVAAAFATVIGIRGS